MTHSMAKSLLVQFLFKGFQKSHHSNHYYREQNALITHSIENSSFKIRQNLAVP